MKNKKILSSVLVLAVMFMFGSFAQAVEYSTNTYTALSDFYDMDPALEHNEPYVDTVISCNMVLKPKTQINLSRLCSSAVTNLNYYFNDSGDVQKGPDYNNTVKEEIFYPASKRISNSYLGGTIDYKVLSELQTKKSTGDKINLETPAEFKHAVIISSKTVLIENLGQNYTLVQPTGDQSQPDYTATKPGIPAKEGRSGHWTVRFGTLDDNTSNVSGFFKSSKAAANKILILDNLMGENLYEGEWEDQMGEGTDHIVYWGTARATSLNDEKMEACKKAKRLLMEYNLDPGACDGEGHVLIEDGWVAIDADKAKQFLKVGTDDKGNDVLYYPEFDNAWGRIYAIMTEPSTNDYRPAKRVRVKARIGTNGGFKFNNLVDGDVVKIYTVNGQKVAELNAGETSEGFEWKGRKGTNNSGDWAKSGIYVYQIKLKDGKIISGTIVLAY